MLQRVRRSRRGPRIDPSEPPHTCDAMCHWRLHRMSETQAASARAVVRRQRWLDWRDVHRERGKSQGSVGQRSLSKAFLA